MSAHPANPFPGLRPFDPSENHLFFGRDRVVDELLARLRSNRFLAVIGSSGCGKSSVVRAGLIPALYGGHMTAAGSSWRIALMRPGADPIGNLAAALNTPGALVDEDEQDASAGIFRQTTLRRSRKGLADVVAQARLAEDENVLVIVDQFEELFRYKRRNRPGSMRDEALAFVKRLLTATEQGEVPVYVAITMRSDFIGDCIEYPGLPEALNAGQYLVPRMNRDELRLTITGPVAVAGADIATRLSVRLLNDTGDDPDQLPVLQHALMRTWDEWAGSAGADEPLDLVHYEATGTMSDALSRHAEEALNDLSDAQQRIAERVFKALTDTAGERQPVRRPTTVRELITIAAASAEDIGAIIERFRQPGTSFLMPPADVPLADDTVVDVSHESLIRGWDRLRKWAREERDAAQTYLRIAEAAAHHEARTGSLWRAPELDLGLAWYENQRPSAAWARRYDPGFERAVAFLEASRTERDAAIAALERARLLRLRAVSAVAIALAAFATFAWLQRNEAVRERERANANLEVARDAVGEMLAEVGRESLADVPQMEQVRTHLLAKAQTLYEDLARQMPGDNVDLIVETALARGALGDVHRLKGERAAALENYEAALVTFSALAARDARQPAHRRELAAMHNRLGEFYIGEDLDAAERAYLKAIELIEALVAERPDDLAYAHDLALAYNNLGIAYRRSGRVDEAIEMFARAIERFERLTRQRDDAEDNYRLAQAHNNLGNALAGQGDAQAAVVAHERAIETLDRALRAAPAKREYQENLAKFYNNLAHRLERLKQYEAALAANTQAIELLERLAQPVPQLTEELANTLNSRGTVLLQLRRADEAEAILDQSVRLIDALPGGSPQSQERLGNALTNLAVARVDAGDFARAFSLLDRAVLHHERALASASPSASAARNLANTRWVLAETHLRAGDAVAAAEAAAMIPDAFAHPDYHAAAARLSTRAAIMAQSDGGLAQPERNAGVERLAAQAVTLLGAALATGYDVDNITVDGPFRFLADRADFQLLLEEYSRSRGSEAEE